MLGSGAREHAIAWKFSISNGVTGLYCAPGNAGTAEIGENLEDLNPENSSDVIKACKEYKIDYVFVGPEAPLEKGVVDDLQKANIAVFGPHKKAAQLESSKVFSKQFMNRNGIATAQSEEFHKFKPFKNYLKENSKKLVIKKSGLAAGKGVFESDDNNDLISFGKDILKNDKLLVEEFLEGYEISIFTLSDGENFKMLPPCADFKKAGEGDMGLNTGGMGSICPVPVASANLIKQIEKEIIEPTYKGMKKEGLSYKGILYFGLMITKDGPKLLEYNVRFGDPETQALIPLLNCDFVNLMRSIEEGTLGDFEIPIFSQYSLGVVVAAEGYPGQYKKGIAVDQLPSDINQSRVTFQASTTIDEESVVRTGGGRCFTVVGLGDNLIEASRCAYNGVKEVQFEGGWSRSDIGKKFFLED